MRVRRGFAGEGRWRKAGIAGEKEKSPERGCLREVEITKKEEEGLLYLKIPTDTGSSVFRRYN